MAEVHGSEARLYMGGMDLSGYFDSLEGGADSHDLHDATMFGATADSHVVSPIFKRMMSGTGILDADPDTGAAPQHDKIQAAFSAATPGNVITWAMRDTTLGDPALIIVGSVPKATAKNAVRDIVRTALSAQSDISGWARALRPKSTLTGAGSSVGDIAAGPTTNGGISVLQVFSLTGTTPVLTVKTQHSSDTTDGTDGTWVDLATHAAINAAGVTAGYADVQIVAPGTLRKATRSNLAVTSGSLTNVVLVHHFVRFP